MIYTGLKSTGHCLKLYKDYFYESKDLYTRTLCLYQGFFSPAHIKKLIQYNQRKLYLKRLQLSYLSLAYLLPLDYQGEPAVLEILSQNPSYGLPLDLNITTTCVLSLIYYFICWSSFSRDHHGQRYKIERFASSMAFCLQTIQQAYPATTPTTSFLPSTSS